MPISEPQAFASPTPPRVERIARRSPIGKAREARNVIAGESLATAGKVRKAALPAVGEPSSGRTRNSDAVDVIFVRLPAISSALAAGAFHTAELSNPVYTIGRDRAGRS